MKASVRGLTLLVGLCTSSYRWLFCHLGFLLPARRGDTRLPLERHASMSWALLHPSSLSSNVDSATPQSTPIALYHTPPKWCNPIHPHLQCYWCPCWCSTQPPQKNTAIDSRSRCPQHHLALPLALSVLGPKSHLTLGSRLHLRAKLLGTFLFFYGSLLVLFPFKISRIPCEMRNVQLFELDKWWNSLSKLQIVCITFKIELRHSKLFPTMIL